MSIGTSEEKNILLLSMSTLPSRGLKENQYQFKGVDKLFLGVSQLEPGTQYYIRSLVCEGRTLDRIYIIASQKTRDPLDQDVIAYILDHGFLSENEVPQNEEHQKIMTTVEFFEARIRRYIAELALECRRELGMNNNDNDDLFKVIPLDDVKRQTEKNPLDISINSLCSALREEKSDTKKVNLFLNMQGGRRYEVFIINAAVQMVEKKDSIWVEGSNAIAYDYEGDGPQPIEDTTINDRIFELVSGMNEFMRTGRGDTLKDFMEDTRELEGIGLKFEKPIIEAIANISDAISLCDVQKFGIEVTRLKGELTNYKNLPDSDKNLLFQSILTNFEDDYGVFLSDEKVRVIDQIDWCITKKLYQQALTLLEAKVPDDFVNDKIFCFTERSQLEDLVNRVFNAPKYLMENYSDEVEDSIDKASSDADGSNGHKKVIKDENVNFVFIKYAIDKDKLDKDNTLVLKAKGISSDELTEPVEGIDLLRQYFNIAHMRNDINHAGIYVDRPNNTEIFEALKLFSQSYRNVLEQKVSVNFSDIVRFVEDTETLEKNTFAGLPEKDSLKLLDTLKEIWGDNNNAIDAFVKINAAILQMEGLKWETFKHNKSKYQLLNCLLEYLIIQDAHGDAVSDRQMEDRKHKRFTGKDSFERFVNSLQKTGKARGFYEKTFGESCEE